MITKWTATALLASWVLLVGCSLVDPTKDNPGCLDGAADEMSRVESALAKDVPSLFRWAQTDDCDSGGTRVLTMTDPDHRADLRLALIGCLNTAWDDQVHRFVCAQLENVPVFTIELYQGAGRAVHVTLGDSGE